MRSEYYRKILEIFAESYPGSAQFKGGRQLRKSDWDHVFQEINDSPDAKESFISAVEELVDQGIISVKWIKFKKGDKVDALYLKNPAVMYELLGEDTPENIRESILSLVNSYKTNSTITLKIIEYIRNNYVSGDREILTNYDDIRDILILSELSPEEALKYNIRAVSVKLFNNSKRIETIKDKADKICALCGEQSLSERLGIERKFPETSISGIAIIEFENGVRWPLERKILTLPLLTVLSIKDIIIPKANPRILSIENKETFYVLSDELDDFDLFFYCSGKLNSADKAILKIFNNINYEFYHTGDLDPDGLKIFNEIDFQLDGKIKPYKMDVKTYTKYLKHGYKLSDGALKYFDRYDNSKLKELADEIFRSGQGVEQEIINYFSGD